MAALLIGFCAGLGCYVVVELVVRGRLDDSLDVFGVHGVGGMIGMLAAGVFATRLVNPAGTDGLLAGNPGLLGSQVLTILAVAAYSGTMTWGLLRLVDGRGWPPGHSGRRGTRPRPVTARRAGVQGAGKLT
jgi:ammonium transporter, Amt family